MSAAWWQRVEKGNPIRERAPLPRRPPPVLKPTSFAGDCIILSLSGEGR